MNNSKVVEVSIFKNILSYPLTALKNESTSKRIPTTPLETPLSGKHTFRSKRKARSQALAGQLVAKSSSIEKHSRPPISLPIAIKLIWPGKQRVKVSPNIFENTCPKWIHELQLEDDTLSKKRCKIKKHNDKYGPIRSHQSNSTIYAISY